MNSKRRPRIVLPDGMKFEDISFTPTWQESYFDRLHKMKALWAKQDDILRRAREISAQVEQARLQQQREDKAAAEAAALDREVEAAIERRKNYYLEARKAEGPVTDKLMKRYAAELDGGWREKALAKLAKLTKEIQRDAAKEERRALAAKGLIRGRR